MVLEGVILIAIILAKYVHHGRAGMDREYSLIGITVILSQGLSFI